MNAPDKSLVLIQRKINTQFGSKTDEAMAVSDCKSNACAKCYVKGRSLSVTKFYTQAALFRVRPTDASRI